MNEQKEVVVWSAAGFGGIAGTPSRSPVLVLLVCSAVVLFRPTTAPTTTNPTPPSTTEPSPTTSAYSPASTTPDSGEQQVMKVGAGPLLPGAKNWDVYVQAAAAVYRLEPRTGLIVRTKTAPLTQHPSFVAGDGQVIFKSIGFSPSAGSQPPAQGTVIVDGSPAAPLPAALNFPGRLYPGPDGELWSVPEVDSTPTTATRFSFTGAQQNGHTMVLPSGYAIGDAAGSLLLQNAAGIYQLTTTGPRHLSRGTLLGVGRHHLLVWDCNRAARCQPYRLNRATQDRTALPDLAAVIRRLNLGADPDSSFFGAGDLSPDGRHIVLTSDTGRGSLRLAVISLDQAAVQPIDGAPTDSNPNTQYAWTPDSRWLLALTDHRIRAHDTTTGHTRTLEPTNQKLLHLTMAGATGN